MPENDPRFKRDGNVGSGNRCGSAPMGKSVNFALKTRMNLRKKREVKLQDPEEILEQERKLISKCQVLIDKMQDHEDNNQAYNVSRMEITKKAIQFQLDRNKKKRDRNNVVLKTNND